MRCSKVYLFALILLASCKPAQTPEQVAFLHELADRPMTCSGKHDCDAKWGRAVEWVSAHTRMGMRDASDWLITTNTISNGARPATHYTEFAVVRFPEGDGYRMKFQSYCDFGLACNPNALQQRADFVTFVMGTPPGVVETSPGVFERAPVK